MNKKLTAAMLAAVMMLQLTACGNGTTLGDSGSETLSKRKISVKEIDDSEYYVMAFKYYKEKLIDVKNWCTCPYDECVIDKLLFMMPTPAKEELDYTETTKATAAYAIEGSVMAVEVITSIMPEPEKADIYYNPNNGYYDGETYEDMAIVFDGDVMALYEAESSKMHEYTVDEAYKDNAYYTQLDADYKKVYDDLYLWCDIIMRHKYDVVPATGNSYYVDYIYFTDEDFEDKKELAMEFIKANPQFFFIESLEYDTSGRLWLKMYDGYENGEARVAEAERRSE